jgi:nitrite reductase (NADH) large subunit
MRHVIVGNGVAGVTAAIELSRREAGEIDVYTAEPYPYYYRPRINHYLAGEVSVDQMFIRPDSWYTKRGIHVHLSSRVVRLVPGQKRIELADGAEVPYDRLLLATGSIPSVPPIEGTDKEGVFTLRTLGDAQEIKAYAAQCEKAVVIGGGLLGLESARALREQGLEVSVLEFFPRLLPRQLDQEGASLFQDCVEDLGLGVILSANTRTVLGDGQVEGIRLQDGREIAAQMVLIAAGVRCETTLAREAGLQVERGIVVDERMATSAEDVYCAGDAASFRGNSWGIIPVAQAQARVAAANMAGEEELYEEVVPSTTLHIVGIDLTSVGKVVVEEGAQDLVELRRSDLDAGVYKKVVMEGNRLVGAIVIGDSSLAKQLEGLVAAGARITRQEAGALLE